MAQAPARERTVLWAGILHDLWGGFAHVQTKDLLQSVQVLSPPHHRPLDKFPIRLQSPASILTALRQHEKQREDLRIVSEDDVVIVYIGVGASGIKRDPLFLTPNARELFGCVTFDSLIQLGQWWPAATIEVPMQVAQRYLPATTTAESEMSDEDAEQLGDEIKAITERLEHKWQQLSDRQASLLDRLEHA
jgi:hypothetical protein